MQTYMYILYIYIHIYLVAHLSLYIDLTECSHTHSLSHYICMNMTCLQVHMRRQEHEIYMCMYHRYRKQRALAWVPRGAVMCTKIATNVIFSTFEVYEIIAPL